MIRTDRELLVHREFSYGSDQDFTETAAGFLRAGLGTGEALVAVTTPDRFGVLCDLVAGPLECLDSADWFRTPPRTLAATLKRAHDKWWPLGGVRLVAEPVWTGRSPGEIREWKRYESLLNVVFAASPTRLLCAYDERTVPADILRDARRTHQGDGFVEPLRFTAECDRAPLATPRDPIAHRGFRRSELFGVRSFTEEHAGALGLKKTLPLVLAVNEVATNILKHGSGRGTLWIWSDGADVVCDLIDHDFQLDEPFLGFLPPDPSRTGDAGMWAVRQLCDLVEIRTGESGTLFRLRITR